LKVFLAKSWLAGVTSPPFATTPPPTAYIYMAFLAESRQVRQRELLATFRKRHDVVHL
jgi:hypothetical protein